MGYDEQLFLRHVRDEFKCPICRNVLQDPLTITGCEHVFCSNCINYYAWLGIRTTSNQHLNFTTEHNDCPVCKTVIPNKLTDVKPPLRQFKSLLDSLRLRCSFEQCQVVTTLGSFEEHLDVCPKNPVNAPYSCPKFCGAEIRRNEEHECLKFLSEKVVQLEMTVSHQTDQLGTLQEENVVHLEEIGVIQELNQHLTNENDLLKMELQSSKDENSQLRRQNQSVEEERVMLQVMNEQLTEVVKQRDETVDNQTVKRENQYRVVNEENRKLAAELERKSAQYDILKQKLARFDDEKRTTEERLNSVTEQYNLLDKAHKKLKELYEGQNKLLKLQEQIKQGQSD